jgi:hypothetical protein
MGGRAVVRLKIVCGVALGALMTAGGALAAEAAKPPAYQGNAGNVQQEVKGAANTLGSLPFTGLDLALIVGGGLLLVIAGVALRRIATRRAAA